MTRRLALLVILLGGPTRADTLISASVAPSGMGLVFVARDSATNRPSPISALSDQREAHTLAVAADSGFAPFTLTWNGNTSVPIARIPRAPPAWARWSAALPAAGSYDLAINLPAPDAFRSIAQLHEVFGGDPAVPGTRVGTATVNLVAAATDPARFSDGTLRRDGSPVQWMPLGRFAIPSTSLFVRVSGPDPGNPGALLYADALRIAPVAGGAVTIVGPDEPPGSSGSDAAHAANLQAFSQVYDIPGGPARNHQAGGSGMTYVIDPAAVRAALGALPGVGAANLAVSGDGSPASPIRIAYIGTFGTSAVPLPASSDPTIVVARAAAGDNWPYVRINGGARVKLTNPYWGTGHGDLADPAARTQSPYLPFVYFPLIQPAPAVRRERIGTFLNAVSGPGWAPHVPGGYALAPQASSSAGASARWSRPGMPAGAYRLSPSWVADPANTVDALFTVRDRDGATRATLHVNQTLAPSGPADDGVPWQVGPTVTLTALVDDLTVTATNAAGAGNLVADAVRFERTSAAGSLAIPPGASVTYDAGVGWAVAGSGPAPSVAAAPMANLAGIYPVTPDVPRTMPLGWNVNNPVLYSPVMEYANLMRVWEEPPGILEKDADGYPVRLSVPTLGMNLCIPPPSLGGDGRGWPYLPEGEYTVRWDGASVLGLSDGGPVAEITGRAIVGSGGVGNRRTFRLSARGGNYSPVVGVSIGSTGQIGPGNYAADVRNVRVTSPGVDDANPPKFHPGFSSKTLTAKSLRWLDPIQAIDGNAATPADFEPPQSRIARYGHQVNSRIGIAEVRGDSGFWRPEQGVIVRVTTAAPHGMVEGGRFFLEGPAASVALSDGTSFELQPFGMAHVLTATTFSYQFGPRAAPAITMTNTLTNPGNFVSYRAGNNHPFSDMVEACNAGNGGAGAGIYINLPHTVNDAACTWIGTYLAQNLRAGAKARVEWGNEVWNFFFPAFAYVQARSYADGLGSGPVPWQCKRSKEVWDRIAAAMGSRSGDLVRVMGSQFGNPGVTEDIAAYCQAHSIAFDELAIAPYIGNNANGQGNEPAMAPIVDLFDSGGNQDLDLHELFRTYGGFEGVNVAHLARLAAHGFGNVKLCTYEGGPAGGVPFPVAGRIPSRATERSHAVHRHPRYYHLLLSIWRQEQDSGMAGPYHLYDLASAVDYPQVDGSVALWSAYVGTSQVPGTGDPILDAFNLSNPDRMDTLKSEPGGAFNHWNSLVGSGPPIVVPPVPPPHRHGPAIRPGPIRRKRASRRCRPSLAA